MPEISRFYGLVVKMFHNDHPPAHFHVEHDQGQSDDDFVVLSLYDVRPRPEFTRTVLPKLLPIDYCLSVETVVFTHAKLTRNELIPLEDLPHVRALELGSADEITDDAIDVIASYNQIEVITLSNKLPQRTNERIQESLPECAVWTIYSFIPATAAYPSSPEPVCPQPLPSSSNP